MVRDVYCQLQDEEGLGWNYRMKMTMKLLSEGVNSEQSDTTFVVLPRDSLHSSSTRSSPMAEKRDLLPADIHSRSSLLCQP